MGYPEMGFADPKMKYDYTQYSHDNDVNIIPKEDYRRLVQDTFKIIADNLRNTYGPYGSSVIMTDQNVTTATKDGYNTFQAMHFSHNYKQQVYLHIQEIINRVNSKVGDGTTSCILLAEKMFNELNSICKNAEDERRIKGILEEIENNLQNPDNIESDKECLCIHKLNNESLLNTIRLAANYDDKLSNSLVEAMNPTFDEDGNVLSIRNIIVDENRNSDESTDIEYSYVYLPGDYRINVDIHPDLGNQWTTPQKFRILICDHTFTEQDWMKLGDKEDADIPVLVIAQYIAQDFFDNVYTKQYIQSIGRFNMFNKQLPESERKPEKEIKFFFCQIKGGFIKNEIKDLCAVLDIKPMTFEAVGPIDYEYYTKEYQFSIANGNVMCFYDCKPATEYANLLKAEIDADLSKSITKKTMWYDRINACLLKDKDTIFKIKSGNRIQTKLIQDKITDCCSIVKSALDNGVVSNLLGYGHLRMLRLADHYKDNKLGYDISRSIIRSIEGLFDDIWNSKYGYIEDETERNENLKYRDELKEDFYFNKLSQFAFDIVSEECCGYYNFPTSSQYDIEVISAGIAIVKFMLISKAFIFDSCLLKPHGDKGHIDPYSY